MLDEPSIMVFIIRHGQMRDALDHTVVQCAPVDVIALSISVNHRHFSTAASKISCDTCPAARRGHFIIFL